MIQRENPIQSVPVDTPVPGAKLYDLSILLEMDDNDYVVEIVTMFLNDTPKELKQIRDAISAGQPDEVCRKAHKLKSSAGIVQAHYFVAQLSEMETGAKAGKSMSALGAMMDKAARQFKDLETALQKLLKSMNA